MPWVVWARALRLWCAPALPSQQIRAGAALGSTVTRGEFPQRPPALQLERCQYLADAHLHNLALYKIRDEIEIKIYPFTVLYILLFREKVGQIFKKKNKEKNILIVSTTVYLCVCYTVYMCIYIFTELYVYTVSKNVLYAYFGDILQTHTCSI